MHMVEVGVTLDLDIADIELELMEHYVD